MKISANSGALILNFFSHSILPAFRIYFEDANIRFGGNEDYSL